MAALDAAVSQEVLDYLHSGDAPDVAAVVRRMLDALLAGACPELPSTIARKALAKS